MLPFLLPMVAEAGLGLYEYGQSQKRLNELDKTPYPKYTIDPVLSKAYARAEQMAQSGYTPEERASFENKLAGQQMAGYKAGTARAGGQLSGALAAGMRAQALDAQNQYAMNDAQLKRGNIRYSDSLARAIQSQQNLATQAEQRRRTMEEQALGGAMKAGLTNITNALGGAGTALYGQSLRQAAPSLSGRPVSQGITSSYAPPYMALKDAATTPEVPKFNPDSYYTPQNTDYSLIQNYTPYRPLTIPNEQY